LDTDVPPGSAAHDEVSGMLASFGLDLAAWRFETSQNSRAGRPTQDGGHMTCPALTLMVRRKKDFDALGISSQAGNWNDDWCLTSPIRDALNDLLRRHGLADGYISPATFVFVQSWETRAYFRLGRMVKPRISKIVRTVLPKPRSWRTVLRRPNPPSVYFGSYWGDEPDIDGQFNLLFPDEAAMRQALPFLADLRSRATEEMRKADRWGFCASHEVEVELFHAGMTDLPALYRED
jgi:hypothetical protein